MADQDFQYHNILDVSKLNLKGSFDAQVQDILSFIRLTREEVIDLRRLHSDLENELRNDWPGCKVHPFGSIITGLGIKTSDADCYVDIKCAANPKRAVVIAKKRLMKSRWLFEQPFAITGAKVPIVQFLHTPTQMHCDVSFSSRAGVRNSELISFLLQIDKRALQLAIIIKYWSKVHKLTGTNLFPNYSLIMLVIFYLQHLSILPPVRWLQSTAYDCDIVEGWNTSFNCSLKDIPPSEDITPLHKLLGDFFLFYRDFNFKDYIISPYLGQPILRSLFNRLEDVPGTFSMYIDKVSGRAVPLKTDTLMCVQDPFQHNRNCTVAVHQKLMMTMTNFFALGANIYEECRGHYDKFLPVLLSKRPQNLPEPDKKNNLVHKRPGRVAKKPKVANVTLTSVINGIKPMTTVTAWNQHFLTLKRKYAQKRPFRRT